MRVNRAVRVFFGIILLAIFSFYSYNRYVTSPKSSDFDSGDFIFVYSDILDMLEKGESIEDRYPELADKYYELYGIEAESASEIPAEEAAPAEESVVVEEIAVMPEEPEQPESDLPQIDLADWKYMLVNASHPLDGSYAPPEIVNVSPSQCPVDSRIQTDLEAFLQGCTDAGLPVYLSSGYRAYSEQDYLFQRKLGQGYTYEGASTIVAPPGTSEHQTGLACDITDVYRESKSWETLEPTATFQWLNEHCAEYGFILRYPKEKSGLYYDGPALQTITGIVYEPWHFRYVGVEAATYMKEHDLCLEEFIALYQ